MNNKWKLSLAGLFATTVMISSIVIASEPDAKIYQLNQNYVVHEFGTPIPDNAKFEINCVYQGIGWQKIYALDVTNYDEESEYNRLASLGRWVDFGTIKYIDINGNKQSIDGPNPCTVRER